MRPFWENKHGDVTVHRPPTREDWLSLRERAVTASQVGALVGIHDYISLFELWANKSGLIKPSTEGSESVLVRGELLEDDAVELLRRQNPSWMIHHNIIGQSGVYLEDSRYKLGATPDVFAMDDSHEPCVVEIKTTDIGTFFNKWNGKDEPEPPLWIAVQAMLAAHLAGTKHAYVCLMVVGRTLDLHLMRIDVKPGLIHRLQEASLAFWEQVRVKEAPDPNFETDGKVIAALRPQDDGTDVDLSDDNELTNACGELLELKKQMSAAKNRAERLESIIRHRMGTHATATIGSYYVSLKTILRKAYMVNETTYRRLNVKEGKVTS